MINNEGNKQYLWSYTEKKLRRVGCSWQTFSASVLGPGVPEMPISSALGGQAGVWDS